MGTEDVEVDIHVWKKPGTEEMEALYTLSVGKRGLCYDVPKHVVLEVLDRYLDDLEEEN